MNIFFLGFLATVRGIKRQEKQVSMFECDFSNGICNMKENNGKYSTRGYTWWLHQGPTFTQNTGPRRDASGQEKGCLKFFNIKQV